MPQTPQKAGLAEEQVRKQLTTALKRAAAGNSSDSAEAPLLGEDHPDPQQPGAAAPALKPARPITFNAAMVRAILAGNKTQTRRPIRPAPAGLTERRNRPWPADEQGKAIECTLAAHGEILWVREPWTHAGTSRGRPKIEFEADFGPAAAKEKSPWRPGRFLPRELSRLEIEVRSVYPQGLHAMKPQDAIAEGVSPVLFEEDPAGAIEEFRRMWDAFYGLTDFAWESDPWVWVVRFKSVEPPE